MLSDEEQSNVISVQKVFYCTFVEITNLSYSLQIDHLITLSYSIIYSIDF